MERFLEKSGKGEYNKPSMNSSSRNIIVNYDNITRENCKALASLHNQKRSISQGSFCIIQGIRAVSV